MNKIDKIIDNRIFAVYGRRRKVPNDFTRLADAVEDFQNEIFKALYIPQIANWLNKKLTKK